ncbi:MAG: hypothetical protein R3C14_55015 [Caldilineaceae bacterium]
MARLRLPFFAVALLLILVIVLVERSALSASTVAARLAGLSTSSGALGVQQALDYFSPEQSKELARLQAKKKDEIANLPTDLKGYGVTSLQYVDAILLFTLLLMTLALVIPAYVHAKIQGCLTLLFALLLIFAAIATALLAFGKALVMISLLLSFPFGTIAYLIIYGSFPRSAMAGVLSLLFTLKILFGVALVLAHQRFLENKGLVIFFIVALVANVVVSFLHGLVPGFLVSITDAIAAIVVAIIAIILAIVLLVGAVISIVLALKPR